MNPAITARIAAVIAFFGIEANRNAIKPGFALSPCETITDPAGFLTGHIETVRHATRDKNALPYLVRLEYIMNAIK